MPHLHHRRRRPALDIGDVAVRVQVALELQRKGLNDQPAAACRTRSDDTIEAHRRPPRHSLEVQTHLCTAHACSSYMLCPTTTTPPHRGKRRRAAGAAGALLGGKFTSRAHGRAHDRAGCPQRRAGRARQADRLGGVHMAVIVGLVVQRVAHPAGVVVCMMVPPPRAPPPRRRLRLATRVLWILAF